MAGENDTRNDNVRTARWNATFLVFSTLLSLILWEILLRGIFIHFVHQSLGEHTTRDEEMLFRLLDTDHNGFLSTYEWLPYFYQCASIHPNKYSTDLKEKNSTSHDIESIEEIITIRAFFEPVQLETLKKDLSSSSTTKLGALTSLVSWTHPHHEWKNFAAHQFSVFLPPQKKLPKISDTWWVVAPIQASSGQLSSKRHNPPPVAKHLEFLTNLFGMFHTRPFLVTRFHPQGTLAILRGENSQLLDIVFRVHIEFQLNEPDKYPFWFTPGQLRGRIILDRSKSTVHYFSLELPTNRRLNVDMEWLNGPDEFENMEVDIAFVPLMSLKSAGPSVRINISETKDIWGSAIDRPKDYEKNIESILWDKEITMEQALQKLENEMYSFTKVPYYNLTEAFRIAKEQNKLVHAILLWGSLDDQSC